MYVMPNSPRPTSLPSPYSFRKSVFSCFLRIKLPLPGWQYPSCAYGLALLCFFLLLGDVGGGAGPEQQFPIGTSPKPNGERWGRLPSLSLYLSTSPDLHFTTQYPPNSNIHPLHRVTEWNLSFNPLLVATSTLANGLLLVLFELPEAYLPLKQYPHK